MFVLSFFFSFVLHAFPVLIPVHEVSEALGSSRSSWAAFRVQGNSFERIPLQIDELENQVALVIRKPQVVFPRRKELKHAPDNDPFAGELTSVHRFVLDDREFTTCDNACEKNSKTLQFCSLNKRVNTIIKIELEYLKKSAFLVQCDDAFKELPKKRIADVNLDRAQVKASNFHYQLNSKRSILPKQILLTGTKPQVELISGSEVYLKLIPKWLFPVTFAEQDIVSEFTGVKYGPLSTSIEVAFAMDVLGIKVGGQICCDVSVYQDSIYLPIMIRMPFHGQKFRSGSGLYFGLQYPGDLQQETSVFMDEWGVQVDRNKASLNSVLVHKDNLVLAIGFRGSKDVIPKVLRQSQFKSVGISPKNSNIGVFYDVTELNEGFQHFDIWFYLGNKEQSDMLLTYAAKGVSYTLTNLLLARMP